MYHNQTVVLWDHRSEFLGGVERVNLECLEIRAMRDDAVAHGLCGTVNVEAHDISKSTSSSNHQSY
jgi:hypothetical protein